METTERILFYSVELEQGAPITGSIPAYGAVHVRVPLSDARLKKVTANAFRCERATAGSEAELSATILIFSI